MLDHRTTRREVPCSTAIAPSGLIGFFSRTDDILSRHLFGSGKRFRAKLAP